MVPVVEPLLEPMPVEPLVPVEGVGSGEGVVVPVPAEPVVDPPVVALEPDVLPVGLLEEPVPAERAPSSRRQRSFR